MNFLIDAHLPRRLIYRLQEAGHDAIHTLDLPQKNRTSDLEINMISVLQERIVITKDNEFVDSLILSGKPYKLLLISTGNIANAELEALLVANLKVICDALLTNVFVELNQTRLIIHF